jgi:hypothetical protein
MKNNTKYTAIEILKLAGIEKPEEKIGKMRVRIAGIAGIVKPDQLIKIQPGTTEVEVIVGQETATIPVEKNEEAAVSDAAKATLEAKGKIATKQAEAIAKAKVEPATPEK